MHTYVHKINYYETDKMGITHHSNYVRFMEEARLSYLESVGYPLTRLESEGITSPVVSVSCDYKKPTTFGDEVEISVSLKKYTGVRLTLEYVMKNRATGEIAAVGKSSHCFIDSEKKPVAIAKKSPEFDKTLRAQLES